jgi:hypothetical protein
MLKHAAISEAFEVNGDLGKWPQSYMTFVEMSLFTLLQHSDLLGYLRTTDITTTLQRTSMNFSDYGWRPSSYA